MAVPKFSTPTREVSSHLWRSHSFLKTETSRSSRTAAAPGKTMSLSSVCGGRSNTRRSICGPMPAFLKPAPELVDRSPSKIPNAHNHRLTGRHPIRFTSTRHSQSRLPRINTTSFSFMAGIVPPMHMFGSP